MGRTFSLSKTIQTNKLPNASYALEVDGCIKAEFQTKEGAEKGAVELKNRFPMLKIEIFDTASSTRETIT
jgi:hypothetical protein